MKPLSEQTSFSTPSERSLAALLQNAPRYQPNPFRKRLIRTRLLGHAHRPAPRWLRYAPLAVLLVCTSGAGAALGYRWISGDDPASPPPSQPQHPAPQTPQLAPPPAPTTEAARSAPASETFGPEPSIADRPIVKQRATVDPRALAERDKARLAGEDPSQVLEAVRALRKGGDPAHAQTLLDGYLASHPSGALSEDALALAIEAAAARKDPRAKEYAKRYLAQFPNGRFRQLAHRAIAER